MTVLGIIPARLQSTRLPRKLLLDATGKPLIQYVWEAANNASSLDDVIIATDSLEIANAVRRFGGRAEITGEHPSGTDRIAEVVRKHAGDAEIIVNLQGDEPELDPAHIDRLVATLQCSSADEMATLATPFANAEDVRDPNCVKVVCAGDGRALYFSRSAVPFARDREIESFFDDPARAGGVSPPQNTRGEPIAPVIDTIGADRTDVCKEKTTSTLRGRHAPGTHQAVPHSPPHPVTPSPWLLHLGLYAYRREFLLRLTQLPPSPLEKLEKLEQLRALEAGATIRVAVVEEACVGIDTLEDYERFVARLRNRAA